ncbi:MAG: 1,4-dihydroxy-2-naphthoate octaprenyltransferase [Bacteroidetes bacterium HGW-Bacteroidetes-4]|jgi:1,4-dihydroxy-2-naphthoate octaprenyltransferase|nr:MAG: 1,4-dihydroxy-2-naphthoate octaprenyltransferase [Bacteroidetes bacterium HGW-Bacteroidetes-4]
MNKTKLNAWIHAARLRTLPLSVAGIIMGSSIALAEKQFNGVVFTLAMVTTLLLQILSNLANDYGDYSHGTDNVNRVGPQRAVQSGIIKPREMKVAVIFVSLLTLLTGTFLIAVAFNGMLSLRFFVFLILGLASIAAAIKYTVGKKNFGYLGFGDLMVFIFFGLVSVLGSYFLHTLKFNVWVLLPATTIGLLSSGVLNINNMRDMDNDRLFNKKTIPVRLGAEKSKIYHLVLLFISALLIEVFLLFRGNNLSALTSFVPFLFIFIHGMAVARNTDPGRLDPELKKLSLSTLFLALWCGISLSL